MDKELLYRLINTHDLGLVKKAFKVTDDNSFYLEIFSLIDDEVLNSEERPKKRTKFINQLLIIFYDSLHDHKKDLNLIYSLVEEYITKLKNQKNAYLNDDIDETYYVLKHAIKKLNSLKELTADYLVTNNPNYEYDLLWYLINDVESYEYLEFLVIKNPNIIMEKQDDQTIFISFLKLYYNTICNFSIEDRENKLDFYNQTLTLFLANPNLKFDDAGFDDVLFKVMKDIDSGNFSNGQMQDLRKFKNGFLRVIQSPLILSPKGVEEYHKPWQVGTRLDLRKHETISIDDVLINDSGGTIILDDAYTLFKNEGGYMLYIHFADVPSHLRDEQDLIDQAKQKIFTLRNSCELERLFPDYFSRKYLSLEPNKERYAVSLALEINSRGVIDSINFYETIIQNKRAYRCNEIDSILDCRTYDNSRPLLEEYAIVYELLGKTKDKKIHNIPSVFNSLAGKLTAEYCVSYDLPMIFRNCVPLAKLTNEEQRQKVNDYIEEKINADYLEHFLDQTNGSCRSFYDTTNYGHHKLRCSAYADVSSPIRNFVSAEILRMVKEMIIKGRKSNEVVADYCREFAEIAAQANAVEAMYTKK